MQSILPRAAAGAALAIALGAAAAAQSPSAVVGASYFNVDTDLGDADGFEIDGKYYSDIGSLELQGDVDVTIADEGGDAVGGVLHLFQRDSRRFALGGFGSITVPDEGDETFGFGGEAEVYSGGLTLGGVVGWFNNDLPGGPGDMPDADDSAYGLCGYGKFYGSRDFVLEAGAAYRGSEGPDGWAIGAGAEYMLSGSPFSLEGGIDRFEQEDSDFDATTFRIGGKVHFGSKSLIERDRQGAGMTGPSCLSGHPF